MMMSDAPMAPPSSLPEAASYYAARGWKVFPLKPRSKEPLTSHGVHDASSDADTVRAWWRRWPNANIGVACGSASGFDALDIDDVDAMERLFPTKEDLPITVTSRTSSGWHLLFVHDPRVRNSASKILKGIDTRGQGGYIVLPPSIHPNGHVYQWVDQFAPHQQAVTAWPVTLLAAFDEKKSAPTQQPTQQRVATVIPIDADYRRRYVLRALEEEAAALASMGAGERNHALNRAAFKLGGYVGELTRDEIRRELCRACVANGLVRDDGEVSVRKTIESGLLSGEKHPRPIPEQRAQQNTGPYREAEDPMHGDAWEPPEDIIERSDPGDIMRHGASIADVIAGWRIEGALVHERTGIDALDNATSGGPVYGSRWYFSGAPDAGKTALLLKLAHTFAARGITVGMLAVDEEPGDLVTRLAQRIGLTRAACEQRKESDLDALAESLSSLPIRFYDASWTIELAARDVAELAKERGSRAALCIDSVQTVRCAMELATERDLSTPAAIEARVYAIRAAASEHRMIVFATSEMSRAAYRSKDSRENVDAMAASKWSGSIEYSARVLIAMRSVPKETDLVEVELPKNKHRSDGAVDKLYLRIIRSRQELEETEYTPAEGEGQDAHEARSAADEERILKMAEAILLALVQANAKGRNITGQRELRALVKGRDQIKAAAVANLIATGRIAGGRGQPFVPRYEEGSDV